MRRRNILAWVILLLLIAGVAVVILVRRAAPFSRQADIVVCFDYSPDNITVTRVSDCHLELTFPDGGRDKVGWFMRGKTVTNTTPPGLQKA